jgi:holo-[acyl-carrier protein] synthase
MNLGIDAVDVGRFKDLATRRGDRLLQRLFTPAEVRCAQHARGDRVYERLAGRFALKEATIKAVGRRLPFRDIEVRREASGRPMVHCAAIDGKITASLTHTRRLAVAVVCLAQDRDGL